MNSCRTSLSNANSFTSVSWPFLFKASIIAGVPIALNTWRETFKAFGSSVSRVLFNRAKSNTPCSNMASISPLTAPSKSNKSTPKSFFKSSTVTPKPFATSVKRNCEPAECRPIFLAKAASKYAAPSVAKRRISSVWVTSSTVPCLVK